jgi:hypothetical protein
MRPAMNSTCIKSLSLLLVLGFAVLFSVGCEEEITGPEKIPDCEKYGRAEVTFVNRSSHSTYDVLLDGSRLGSISPDRSISRSVAAGHHSYQFIFSNSGRPACYEAHPNLATCEKAVFSCSNDY